MLTKWIQAGVENKLLQDIHNNVEAGYIDGRPPHHHPSARERSYDPENPPPSCIFVCKSEDLNTISSEDIQEVYRHRHILVTGVPLQDEGFSLATLKNYASLHKVVDMIGVLFCYTYIWLQC